MGNHIVPMWFQCGFHMVYVPLNTSMHLYMYALTCFCFLCSLYTLMGCALDSVHRILPDTFHKEA